MGYIIELCEPAGAYPGFIYEMSFRIKKKMIGTSRAGSIFSVLQSLIFRMDRPDAAIKNPPTIVISVIRESVRKFCRYVAHR